MKNKPTILVVDDEAINVEFIASNLETFYNIKVASNGQIALKILDKFSIDLVLLDVIMPVLDGYDTIKAIRMQEKFNDLPVIFLTSKSDQDSLVYGFELGAKDYVTKPFNAKELFIRVRNHLQTYELIKRLELSYKNLERFIEMQNNIVILSDSKRLKFVNKKFFDYFKYKSLDDFLEEHSCICECFINDDRFFHIGKIKEDENWVEVLSKYPESQRIVAMINKESIPHIFSVSINNFDDKSMILSFTDISETVNESINLKEKINHDKLTGVYNREFFDFNHRRIIKEFEAKGSKLGVAFLDIDHFKYVNDQFGHDVGDSFLIELVNVIKKYSREEDILIRWGGEEFIMLLKVKSIDDLYKALEHLREEIENHIFRIIGQKTMSFGGTIYREDEPIMLTIKRADESLYEAKRTGRNKVITV